jgi:hypothetical protein
MNKAVIRRSLAGAAVLAVPLTLAAVATPAQAHPITSPVTVRLDSLKGSHASGWAKLTPTSSGGLKVQIHDTGMVPGMPHAQHIHGDTSGMQFMCPPASADADGNGFISVEEGLPMYGGIHISLTTRGDTTPQSGLAIDRMPVADSHGNLDYTRTLTRWQLPPGTMANLTHLHIVQHGVDANGNDKYDLPGLGLSTFARSLDVQGIPEEATDGASCGMIVPTGSVNTGGTTTAGVDHPALIGTGIVGLAAAGALILLRRKADRQKSILR